MRPRLSWSKPQWHGCGWVRQPTAFGHRYGRELQAVVATYGTRARMCADRPRAADIRHTLMAVARAPEQAQLDALDSETEARLEAASWALFQTLELRELTSHRLAGAALLALNDLDGSPAKNGRPSVRALQVELVRSLMRADPEQRRGEALQALVADALIACGLVLQLRTTTSADARAALDRTAAELIRLARRPG